MRSFTTFALAATSLTAAAPIPVTELHARQFSPFGGLSFPNIFGGLSSIFGGGNGGAGGFDPAKMIEGMISEEIQMLEGMSSAIAQADAAEQSAIAAFEANPTVSAAMASISAAVASFANEASFAFPTSPSLPSVAARQLLPLAGELAALRGAELAAALEGADAAASPAKPTPSTNVRRQNNNPFAAVEGFFESQAQAQASAVKAAESGLGAFVASVAAEVSAASPTPTPSAAAKGQHLDSSATTASSNNMLSIGLVSGLETLLDSII
jgi:hypothetical protein